MTILPTSLRCPESTASSHVKVLWRSYQHCRRLTCYEMQTVNRMTSEEPPLCTWDYKIINQTGWNPSLGISYHIIPK